MPEAASTRRMFLLLLELLASSNSNNDNDNDDDDDNGAPPSRPELLIGGASICIADLLQVRKRPHYILYFLKVSLNVSFQNAA